MKPFSLLCLIAVFTVSCSKEHKAKSLVQDFLKTELDDYSRYEPVSWGTLDSVINALETNPSYLIQKQRTNDQLERIAEIDNMLSKVDSTYSGYADLLLSKEGATERYKVEKERLDKIVANFQPGFSGWQIKHTYRAPNKVGALELQTNTFEIDKDFKEVNYRMVTIY